MSSIQVIMTPEEFEQWRDSVKLLAESARRLEQSRVAGNRLQDRLDRYDGALEKAVNEKHAAEDEIQRMEERVIWADQRWRDGDIEISALKYALKEANDRKWYQFVEVKQWL